MKNIRLIFGTLLLTLLLPPSPAFAHKPSDSYLSLKVEARQVTGQWDIALRDLEYAIGLDADGNGEITWGELRAKHADIASYALARLKIQTGTEDCPLRATTQLVDDHSDGAYAVLRFEGECVRAADALDIRYSLFFDFDTQHKGLLKLDSLNGTLTGVFAADRAEQKFELRTRTLLEQFIDFGREGVWHIWIGFDHILFLLSLLLPAVLVASRHGQWQASPRFTPVFWDVLKVVTSFTVAHSITLSLAALEVISLPSRLVESTIALSVVLAALNNVRPVIAEKRWMMAFLFGLVHGFGFASVLADLGLPRDALLLALVGFNLGVEAGQLAIVAAFLPLAYALRSTNFYRRGVMTGGSLLIALVALVWMLERVFDLSILTGR
jgi:hypothetical protein